MRNKKSTQKTYKSNNELTYKEQKKHTGYTRETKHTRNKNYTYTANNELKDKKTQTIY